MDLASLVVFVQLLQRPFCLWMAGGLSDTDERIPFLLTV